jgi:hypothetical protein
MVRGKRESSNAAKEACGLMVDEQEPTIVDMNRHEQKGYTLKVTPCLRILKVRRANFLDCTGVMNITGSLAGEDIQFIFEQ